MNKADRKIFNNLNNTADQAKFLTEVAEREVAEINFIEGLKTFKADVTETLKNTIRVQKDSRLTEEYRKAIVDRLIVALKNF